MVILHKLVAIHAMRVKTRGAGQYENNNMK